MVEVHAADLLDVEVLRDQQRKALRKPTVKKFPEDLDRPTCAMLKNSSTGSTVIPLKKPHTLAQQPSQQEEDAMTTNY